MRFEDYVYEDYKEYEKACDKMREHNEGYLEIFSKDLEQKGLTAKTINGHLSNVDFFLNIFLLREGIFTMDEGLFKMDEFFEFFIRKCMWSSPTSIKSTAASFKKFYKSMADHGFISQDRLKQFNKEIKQGVPHWIYEYELFMSDSYDPFW